MNEDSDQSRYDIPDIVYGTWRILDEAEKPNDVELAERFHVCLEHDIDTIDTAEIYGLYQVEAAIGGALKANPELKEQLRIITKAGIDVPSTEKSRASLPHYNATSENLVACVEKSLSLMNIDVIDLFLVHRPDWLTPPEETAAGLDRLLEQGKVKAVGVSNYTIHQFETLDQLMDGRLATNQVEFSPLEMAPLYDGVFDQCVRSRVRPMAWSPLAGGRLFSEKNEAGMRVCVKLTELSPKYGDAPLDALVYAWILSVPANPSVILGTNKVDRIRGGSRANGLSLEREDWYAVWEAAQGKSVP